MYNDLIFDFILLNLCKKLRVRLLGKWNIVGIDLTPVEQKRRKAFFQRQGNPRQNSKPAPINHPTHVVDAVGTGVHLHELRSVKWLRLRPLIKAKQ